VCPEAVLGREVAVGTVHNEMHGLHSGRMLPEAERLFLSPRAIAKGTRKTLSGIALKL
jgi:hypothetical protein